MYDFSVVHELNKNDQNAIENRLFVKAKSLI